MQITTSIKEWKKFSRELVSNYFNLVLLLFSVLTVPYSKLATKHLKMLETLSKLRCTKCIAKYLGKSPAVFMHLCIVTNVKRP